MCSSDLPFPPDDYVGDGFAAIDSPDEDKVGMASAVYPYAPQPGIWYKVIGCVDEKGDKGGESPTRGAEFATALRVDLLVVWNPVPDQTLTLQALADRQRIHKQPGWPAAPDDQVIFLADFMAKRGFAVRETAWIIRKPSWER